MGVKETIAFLGDAGTLCPVLMKNLAEQGNYRLLFVSDDLTDINLQDITGDVELIQCAKEGCWEADIIALVDPEEITAEVVNRIKDVATQKILLCIETEHRQKSCFSIEKLKALQVEFPYSKLVYINVNFQQMTVQVHGDNQEARDSISSIFESSGFNATTEVNINTEKQELWK